MIGIIALFACAGAAGLAGAALGVRNLKRQTVITIERGKPRPVFGAERGNPRSAIGTVPAIDEPAA